MSAEPDDLADLLPDDINPAIPAKKSAVPLKRTAKQAQAAAAAAQDRADRAALAVQNTAAKAQAARLAQIVNLHIAGYSLADIGATIGASEAEVDRMLANEAQRYIRNQPALRTYVRNYISGKYSELLEAVWDKAVDPNSAQQLENFDRAQRVLAQMGRLHGAEAPTQTEMKIEAAPEAVEQLVAALAASQGRGYDVDIFDSDIVEGDVVEAADPHTLVEQTHAALEVSGNRVEESDGDDSL